MNQQLKREIARQYLTKLYGPEGDRAYLGEAGASFSFVEGGRVHTIAYNQVDESTIASARAVVAIEHAAA